MALTPPALPLPLPLPLGKHPSALALDQAANLDRLERRSVYYHTDRLALRPFSIVDAWPLWEATRVARFNEHLLWPQPSHVDQVFERAEAISAEARQRRLGALSVSTRDTGAWVALVRLMPGAPSHLELGLWTHPSFWEGGWSTEITRLAVAVAFEETPAAVLTARTNTRNLAAQRVLEKAGFERYAEAQTVPSEHGAPMPTLFYRLPRGAWRRAPEVACRGHAAHAAAVAEAEAA